MHSIGLRKEEGGGVGKSKSLPSPRKCEQKTGELVRSSSVGENFKIRGCVILVGTKGKRIVAGTRDILDEVSISYLQLRTALF